MQVPQSSVELTSLNDLEITNMIPETSADPKSGSSIISSNLAASASTQLISTSDKGTTQADNWGFVEGTPSAPLSILNSASFSQSQPTELRPRQLIQNGLLARGTTAQANIPTLQDRFQFSLRNVSAYTSGASMESDRSVSTNAGVNASSEGSGGGRVNAGCLVKVSVLINPKIKAIDPPTLKVGVGEDSKAQLRAGAHVAHINVGQTATKRAYEEQAIRLDSKSVALTSKLAATNGLTPSMQNADSSLQNYNFSIQNIYRQSVPMG